MPENPERWRDLIERLLPDRVALVCAMCEVESSWNAQATRFESGYLKRYLVGNDEWCKRCDRLGISLEAAATSYGLMQLMYPTAHEVGFQRCPSLLLEPEINLYYGTKYLRKLLDLAHRYQTEEDATQRAVGAYNAGAAFVKQGTAIPNRAYVTKVYQAAGHYVGDVE